jgi:glucose/arabinose dehydrogenase
MRAPLALLLFAAASARAAALPGFRVQLLGMTAGFASSIAIDSHSTIYYTSTAGNLFRFSDGQSKLVAQVNTVAEGDSGLLGLALRDDNTAIVHYTTPRETADIVSKIDLTTGAETILQTFVCDKDVPQRGSSPEHHGGNPSVAEDGSIFVGIGDYGGGLIAALPEWNGGKIFRLFPDGRVEQFARGLRNPFDMAWDAANQRLIATDNGDIGNDEINVVHQGDFLGWPFTEGTKPPIEGAVGPIYVFPMTVAPTGLAALSGRNSMFPRGYLLGGFVTKAIYYIPDIDARPLPDPIAVIRGETGYIIDVAQAPDGSVYFVSGSAIYKLIEPQRGDCNGDGRVDAADVAALAQELLDGNPEPAIAAQNGSFPGSWGCDVNGDGLIDSRDMTALLTIIAVRSRAVRGGRSGASGRH